MSSKNKKFGVALILVTFILALAMILVNNLAYSTFLNSRTIGVIQRQLQAEYILKSLANYAKAVIEADQSQLSDSEFDSFGQYSNGVAIPPALLGIEDENMTIDLEIFPVEKFYKITKSSINLPPPGAPNNADAFYTIFFYNLFMNLGFNSDQESTAKFGKYKGQFFNPSELVANLIDYQDSDLNNVNIFMNDPAINGGGFSIQGQLDSDNEFKNQPLEKISDLYNIPGFTSERVAKISKYITFEGNGSVNPNFFYKDNIFIQSLDNSIMQNTPNIRQLIENSLATNQQGLSDRAFEGLAGIANRSDIKVLGSRFRILGKIAYGDKTFYLDSTYNKTDNVFTKFIIS